MITRLEKKHIISYKELKAKLGITGKIYVINPMIAIKDSDIFEESYGIEVTMR